MTEDRLRSLFSVNGTITECSLKYTRDGVFRKFAFVGFKDADSAAAAVKHFNRAYIDTSKIAVEIAKDFGDAAKPRAWSKYSRDSSAYAKMMEKLGEKKKKREKKEECPDKNRKKSYREKKLGELLGDLQDDAEFQEFVEAHKSRSNKKLWSDDALVEAYAKTKGAVQHSTVDFSGDSDSGVSESNVSDNEEANDEAEEKKIAGTKKTQMSDVDYLKSKMEGHNDLLSDDSDSESESDDEVEGEDASKDEDCGESARDNEGSNKPVENSNTNPHDEGVHVVKMRGLPNNVKEKQIKDFFHPLTVMSIKIPRNARGKSAFSTATVEFNTEDDTNKAMKRNRSFVGPKKVSLYKMKEAQNTDVHEQRKRFEPKEIDKEADDEEEETIAESGRLFLRNLAYCCTEDDIEAIFAKYGPLTEVHLPVDSLTKNVKGFGFVTFMIPEHAVKAFTELDGTVFQGRMLHILPGKAKKEEPEESEGSSFKKRKEAKQKQSASSSHNWNSLFLGANAVADVMADKYGQSKSQILSTDAKESLGVRMALGETQIVAETREFLVQNGVALDAFSQASGPRSKTVMLAKNLPSGTSGPELHDLFSRHGSVANVILPPSGVTAVVEFLEPSEARHAFRKLAYTKFKHLPLYLEWAPQNVFTEGRRKPGDTTVEKEAEGSTKDEPLEDDGKRNSENEEEEEATESLEPNTILFVKNLNFDTTEESIKEKFGKCGKLVNVTISRKKDMKNPGKLLSMGYGFVEFKKRKAAQKALKTLQHSMLDGHQLELKMSNKTTTTRQNEGAKRQKQDSSKKQTGTKILVRNVPFEAKDQEIKELFGVFGELKTVRLPKKLSGTGSHRGFGFVDFLTKQDAKRAFNALCHSTHLYGRRLVLEWAEMEETVDELRRKTAQHFHEGRPAKRLKKSDLKDDLEDTKDD